MRVLTRTGWMTLQELCEREVDIWNGREWSRVTVKRTGKQPLLEMKINGLYVAASWDHGFLLKVTTSARLSGLTRVGRHRGACVRAAEGHGALRLHSA